MTWFVCIFSIIMLAFSGVAWYNILFSRRRRFDEKAKGLCCGGFYVGEIVTLSDGGTGMVVGFEKYEQAIPGGVNELRNGLVIEFFSHGDTWPRPGNGFVVPPHSVQSSYFPTALFRVDSLCLSTKESIRKD